MTTLPAHQFLDELQIPYEKRTFPRQTEKGAANVARALGCDEGQMVKTLIFEIHTGERVLVLLAADQNAISGHLKKAIGSRNIKLASPAVVLETTGYEIGSIPPFHWQLPGFRTFFDVALLTRDVLGVGAGEWGQEIMITPRNLIRASRARTANLTDREQPVFPAEP